MNRIDRLSGILNMLQSATAVKPKLITQRFGISLRTVYRDIKALEESGVPIAGDSRTGYSLVEGYKLPPLMFSEDEAFAFLAAEKLVDKFTDGGLKTAYKSGVDKIRSVMRVAQIDTLSAVDGRVGMLEFNHPGTAVDPGYLQQVMGGIARRYRILITYKAHSSDSESVREIDPIGIFFSMANWYMIGYCHSRNDYRTFRLSRITKLEQTERAVSKQHPPLDTFLAGLGGEDELQRAVISLKRDDLKIINDSKYYQGLVAETVEDDRAELQFMVFSLERFARWYLSYIDIADIEYPDALQEIVNSILSKAH